MKGPPSSLLSRARNVGIGFARHRQVELDPETRHAFMNVGNEGFRWQGGVMEALRDPGGVFRLDSAYGVSADGSVVVGNAVTASGPRELLWSDGVIEALETLGEGPGQSSSARGISADGLVAVGASRSNSGNEAVRWIDGVPEALGDLDGGSFLSGAFACSADGSVVVGVGYSDLGFEAFRWTEVDGMQRVQTLLEGVGLVLTGWSLWDVQGVSADGMTMVGTGNNPDGQTEAWTATLPLL